MLLAQNMKAPDLVVSEKKSFNVFPIVSLWEIMTPGAGPFLTPGARLAGFTIHSYTQKRKALCLVVSENIFLCFFPLCKSMGANDPRGGASFDPRGMVGRIYKEDHYTLLHTKYESSAPCGFGE